MNKTALLMAILSVLYCSVPAYAIDGLPRDIKNRNMAVWLEGGASIASNKPAGSGAIGCRLGYVGFIFGLGGDMDFKSGEVLDSAPVNPAPLLGITSKYLGRKTVDPALGADMVLFWDITSRIAVFGGPGMYFQEVRNVYEIESITSPASSAWKVGGHYNVDYKKQSLMLAGGGGFMFKAVDFEKNSLILVTGYHSIRGLSAGIGIAF